MEPIWGRQDPGGPHIGPMNFVAWDVLHMRHNNMLLSLDMIKNSCWFVLTYGISHKENKRFCFAFFTAVLSTMPRKRPKYYTLEWRHNECDGVLNHRRLGLFTKPFQTQIKKHQSSASLAFVRGIHWWPVNSSHKGPVTREFSIWWRHHEIKPRGT